MLMESIYLSQSGVVRMVGRLCGGCVISLMEAEGVAVTADGHIHGILGEQKHGQSGILYHAPHH